MFSLEHIATNLADLAKTSSEDTSTHLVIALKRIGRFQINKTVCFKKNNFFRKFFVCSNIVEYQYTVLQFSHLISVLESDSESASDDGAPRELEKIYTVTDVQDGGGKGPLRYLVRWKGCQLLELAPGHELVAAHPKETIAFYQKNLRK